jgi:outer membrane protein OmpA-like peptidoglycan-associated protein
MHRVYLCGVLFGLSIMIAGCASTGQRAATLQSNAAPSDGTNEPVEGGVNVVGGTEEDFIVNVGRRTFFEQSSATLDDTAKMTLDKQAQWLLKYPSWKVKLQGFADDPGSTSEQKTLSQKRADAVKSYLASKGVAPTRMLAKGYGRDRLVGDCTDIECTSQNRRVITNPQEAPEF